MATPSRTLFDANLVTDLFNKVRGKSALAQLSAQEGMPFNGTKEFVFTMDNEVNIVAENGAHAHGGVTFAPVVMVPIKFEYGARVSREFTYAAEEDQIKYLQAFNDGFARKLARGLDIAAMHGFNPKTGSTSAVVGNNHFDKAITQTVKYVKATPDVNLNDAIAIVEGQDGEVNGIAMSKVFSNDMGNVNANNVKQYPAFNFGGVPADLNGTNLAANTTINKGPATYPDHAIVGDFQNAFKWGFGKDIEMEIIEYGDPDNTGADLKGHDQVYLRATAYLGWGILAPEYFARVVTTA